MAIEAISIIGEPKAVMLWISKFMNYLVVP